jgi:hypothetical protein
MMGNVVRHRALSVRDSWVLSAFAAAALGIAACGGDDLCTGPFCVTPPEQPEPSTLAADGNGQTGVIDRPLTEPVGVKVTDTEGRPVGGVTVEFSVASGGGSVSSDDVVSDNLGFARVSWTLGGEIGTQQLRASAIVNGAHLANSPLELAATAQPPQAAKIVLLTGPSETAQSGVPFEQQPVLEVLDDVDQPIAGVEVVASVATGGGSLSGSTSASSDENGHATFNNLALVGAQGAHTIRFSVAVPGVEVTSQPIQLTAGTPASMEGVAPLTYEGTVSSPVTPGPSVLVRDAAGNPVAGVEVTFTPNRNATVSPETAISNAEGIAQVSWTLGSTANVAYSLTARIEGTAIPSVQFSARALPGNAGRLRVAVQPSSPTQSGTPFATQPAIQLEDQNGNPTPQAGVRVTATISSGPTGSLQNATATTDGAGRASFSGLTLTGLVGSYTLSFSAPSLVGVTSSPFTITVGAPARLAVTTVPSRLARSRAALVIQPVVQIQDASGNPVRQAGTVVVVSHTAANTSLSGESAATDENGRAAFTALTIIGIPGPKDLTFSAPNLQSASARVTLVSVETVTGTPSHPTSAVVGTTVAGPVMTWTFHDASTRPVADADFTLELPSGGTAVAPQFSDPFGAVQIRDWTLGTTAGYQHLVLRLPDGRTFRDSILATPDAPADLLLVSGDGQTAPVNDELEQPLVVRVVDRHNNGVPGILVEWATCDGAAGPGLTTDANGYSAVTQPTGDQPTEGCTKATTPQLPGDVVEFRYSVTAASSAGGEQPEGISGAQSRRGGLPPIAPRRSSSAPRR